MDLIRADIFCGAGYAQWLWARAGQDPSAFEQLANQATFRWLTRSPPTRAWRWPPYVRGVDDVLRVTREGFDLVTRFVGKFGDTPIYALTRDGEISPPGIVRQSAAHAARVEYFGHFMKLTDGTLLYKRKAAA